MKIKTFLRFYFGAEDLNGKIDRLILFNASKCDTDYERIIELAADKARLCRLMGYLNEVFDRLTPEDLQTLCRYAGMRRGLNGLAKEDRREIKRAAMKFARRLKYIESYAEEIETLLKYRCLL